VRSDPTTTEAPLEASPPRAVEPLLEVSGLEVAFQTEEGRLQAVRGTSWTVGRGETVVVLGESGSGKSVSAHAVAGLLPGNAEIGGSIKLRGEELVGVPKKRWREIRAEGLGMIFQDPLSSLNPCFSIGDQVAESFRVHRGLRKRAAMARAIELLELVDIREPDRRARQYPHELSGGMRQRVMIAMAISLEPAMLLADEPTTALDTSVRGSVLRTIQDMRDKLGIGVLLITHDVGVAAAVADRVAVMYAGRIVEYGTAAEVLHTPRHPYTAALLASMPRLGHAGEELYTISGTPPSLRAMPDGCAFAPRCSFAQETCTGAVPPLLPVAAAATDRPSGHAAACHFVEELQRDGALAL
jgi:oligopeptide/dipeptide ABC transporter ATP-binding protein